MHSSFFRRTLAPIAPKNVIVRLIQCEAHDFDTARPQASRRQRRILSGSFPGKAIACLLVAALPAGPLWAAPPIEPMPGKTVESLLAVARERNPELASMRLEAEASAERVAPAGALPDPKLRVELMDITKFGEQNPTILPARVESTRYTLMQEVPWFGKRDLKREIAQQEVTGAQGRTETVWAELSFRIKSGFAQLYYINENERLTREILGLMARLEAVAQSRYAGGLAAQQDVIRAQVEQSTLRNELLGLEGEKRQVQARINTALARHAGAPLAEPERLRALPAPAKLTLAALEDRVRARNPQLTTDEARIRGAESARDLVMRNRYPDFSFGIAPNQYRNSIRQWDLMVEVNIPLQQSSRRSQEREAKAMLSAAQARKEATTNQVLGELAENLASVEAARRSAALIADSLLPQAEFTFQAALPGYENGKLDFATLLDAQRQIRQAKQNLIKAQTDAQMRLADIEKLLGEEL
jgi:outer membrane protein TolC